MRRAIVIAAIAAALILLPAARGGSAGDDLDEWGQPVKHFVPDPWIVRENLQREERWRRFWSECRPAAEWLRYQDDMRKAVEAVNARHGVRDPSVCGCCGGRCR